MNPEEHSKWSSCAFIRARGVRVIFQKIIHFSVFGYKSGVEFTKCLSAYIVPNREDLDQTASTEAV